MIDMDPMKAIHAYHCASALEGAAGDDERAVTRGGDDTTVVLYDVRESGMGSVNHVSACALTTQL